MFSPPEMMISLERSLISIAPSGCQTARSPDRHQFPTSVFAVAGFVFEVSLHHGIAAHHDLADRCAIAWNWRHRLGISDRDRLDHRIGNTLPRHPGKALAVGQSTPFRLENARSRGPVGLGGPIKMSNPKPEGFHGAEDGGGRRRATGRNRYRVVERHALLGWRMSQHIQHDWRAAKMRDPMFGDQPKYLCRLDLAKTYLRSAGGDNCPRIGPAGTVEHRQCPKVNAVKCESEAEAVAECRKIGATMTIDDAFWVAGGSGGIEQAKRLPFIGNTRPVKMRVAGGEERLVGMRAYWRDRASQGTQYR